MGKITLETIVTSGEKPVSAQAPLQAPQYRYQRPDLITGSYAQEELNLHTSHFNRPIIQPRKEKKLFGTF